MLVGKEKGVGFGFALPTVLISSVIMLTVLVSAISTVVAVRSALNDQQYTHLAELAGEAGTAYAKACMADNNGVATWSNSKPLKPNTDCNGDDVSGMSAYVYEEDGKRSYFVVPQPVAGNIAAKGYVEVVRTSSGLAWRIWSSDVAMAASGGASMPIGTSVEGYWTSAPTGYLLEDGSAVSRTTYADLFAVIGTTFGSGNGSTTFNLPDSRGRVTVNKSTDTEFNTLGEKYGEKTHVLTIAEMPSHTHTGTTNSAGAHTHTITGCASCGGSNGAILESWGGYASTRSVSTGSAGAHTHTFTTNSTGGDDAHNNIQPSIVVLRVIKY